MMKPLHEHFLVFGAAAAGEASSFANIEYGLRIFILVGTAIYVWRRALMSRKKRFPKEEEEEL